MAEWLCSGLQSRLRRFDSGFSLNKNNDPPRLATIEDSDELLNWRNDVVTRNSFFNKKVINKIDHENGLKKY